MAAQERAVSMSTAYSSNLNFAKESERKEEKTDELATSAPSDYPSST